MATNVFDALELLSKASKAFEDTFLLPPLVAASAPGRVNLMGGAIDYNGGFVFPMALDLMTVITGRKSKDPKICRIKSLALYPEEREVVKFVLPSYNNKLKPSEPFWANYVKGVVSNFHDEVVGFDAVIVSSVPLGGGLSSSASLEVAMYTFLEALLNTKAKSVLDKALACQKAEHEFANVPCGIMDQFVSTMGVAGHALLIDCRSLESFLVPINDPNVVFVIIDSNVKHDHSSSEYSLRRKDCFSAAKIMGKKSLRDATLIDLENFRDKLSETKMKRVRHVITEIERTLKATQALSVGDYTYFGKLMNESHNSLKVDYEVSCDELDQLVELAVSVPGVFGSRLTGGGFGGCTVSLVKEECVADLTAKVKKNYFRNAIFYKCHPSHGAKILMNLYEK